jgi:hypothetical protein
VRREVGDALVEQNFLDVGNWKRVVFECLPELTNQLQAISGTQLLRLREKNLIDHEFMVLVLRDKTGSEEAFGRDARCGLRIDEPPSTKTARDHPSSVEVGAPSPGIGTLVAET